MIALFIAVFAVMLATAFLVGTKVYIEGVGFRTVEDTDGGAMGNEWIDLYLGDYESCVQWGDRQRKVWKVTE